jgi:hypothetical protein
MNTSSYSSPLLKVEKPEKKFKMVQSPRETFPSFSYFTFQIRSLKYFVVIYAKELSSYTFLFCIFATLGIA